MLNKCAFGTIVLPSIPKFSPSLRFTNHACVFFLWDVPEGMSILHTVNRRKANWIGYILGRKCLGKHVIEGKVEGRIEVTWRRGRRHKQLLDYIKEKRRCKLNEEGLDRNVWRTRAGRRYGPVVRQTTEWVNGCHATRLSSYSTRRCQIK
jgi:hypothetical protein